MNYIDINIEKSKKKQRLVYKKWIFEAIVDFFGGVILVVSFPALSTVFLYSQLTTNAPDYLITAILIFTLTIGFGGLMLYSILNLDNLKRITGTLRDANKQIIREIAINHEWTIHQDNNNMTVITPKWSWFSLNWGRQIVVIYNKQDILINCMAFGLNDIKSPFHWFGNRKYEKIIKEEFEEKIETSPNNAFAADREQRGSFETLNS